jgi:hypothetical protein
MTPPLPNDDPDIDPEDILAAAEETPTAEAPPEVSESTEDLTAWDEPPAETGTAAPTVRPEDYVPPVEQLFGEGLDEADRDRRMAATDPDFEP